MRTISISKLLRKHRLRPQKKMGQNFLVQAHYLDKLLDALDIYPDEDLMEIGSGLGIFSHQLAEHALEVIAVEKDRRLVAVARKEWGEKKNLRFVEGDFLKLDLPHLLADYHTPIKVVGNIPYYISTPILFKLLENHSLFQRVVLTVQKEVAQRMTAEPGNKSYGVLSILLQAEVVCETLFDLPAEAFYPAPEVLSTAVRLQFPKTPLHAIFKPPLFKRVVKEAFSERRKQIKNTLRSLLKNGKIRPWEALDIDPATRPEQISVAQYAALANFLAPLL